MLSYHDYVQRRVEGPRGLGGWSALDAAEASNSEGATMPTRDAAPVGAPCWVDLMTSDTERHTCDYQGAVEFYRDVFGWATHVVSDTPEFRYTTFRHGDGWLAGIMDASGFLPHGVPAHWSVYFGVEDTDAALAQIVDLGGSILMVAEDTPYGRLAAAADSTGARFKLVSSLTFSLSSSPISRQIVH